MAIREVLSKDDLVKEILTALDEGDSWEACKLAVRWCSLNKARRAECKEYLWEELAALIWGDVHLPDLPFWYDPSDRFEYLCWIEREFRSSNRNLGTDPQLVDVKRFVLLAIAGSNSFATLELASARLCDDEEVVRAAIAKDARAIRYASPRLQAQISPLPPSEHWPRNEPTEFERLWGHAVLLIMLSEEWRSITRHTIRRSLAQAHPEYDAAYWIAHKPELKVLVEDYLMPHIVEKIPTIGVVV